MGRSGINMTIIFFGTPEFVIPILSALHKKYNSYERKLIAVVTQPPKEVGRKKLITRSPVDNWAYKHKIPVITELSDIPKADLGIVAAYGRMIPESVIKSFSSGVLNIHPSVLPQFRGASPVQAALATGQAQTGVSIIKMDDEMDHGPIVAQLTEEIKDDDTNDTLRRRLFDLSTKVLIDLIPSYMGCKINLKNQDHEKATFTKQLSSEDGFIPPNILKAIIKGQTRVLKWELKFLPNYTVKYSPKNVYNLYRALSPWPGIWTIIPEINPPKRLLILKAHLELTMENKAAFIPDIVQLEGKNQVTWKQFKEGHPNAFRG
jgi:methionyl-tRNA formyltransferase